MNISKEIKVGALGVVAIATLYFGFNFLKGSDLFSTTNVYDVIFDDVQGLQTSNAVTYKGVNVGRVMKIEPDQNNENVRVTLAVKKSIIVTDQTTALLSDDGLIGGKMIQLDIKKGKELVDGGRLIGKQQLGLADAAIQKITPALNDVDSLVVSLTKVINDFDQSGTALKALMASATQSTAGVNELMAKNTANLTKITTNAALLTANLNELTNKLDTQITPIMAQTGQFTSNLNKLELEKTVNNLNTTIAGLQAIMTDVNNGQGTIGKLTSDESLYVNIDNTAAALDALLSDMKENPRRYVHFSLFDGKDKSDKKKD